MADENAEMIEGESMNCGENLPDVVASMEMLTVESDVSVPKSTRYSMRKRVNRSTSSEILNRRCSLKPQKRSYSEMDTDGKIRDYYLDRSLKKKPTTTLETIYEEIDGMSENSTVISARKFKRLIQFSSDSKSSDAKIKKRKAKIKRVFGSKFKLKSGSVSMQALIKKLSAIKADAMSPTN
ncbi:uncharacterized protein tant [Chelonus insularis]|uniref:uncharacterized protein tant n=1 Tax=Chelonus insularis TaxID=460826 RepID=UPI00158E7C2E|nr:uncharacterized protein LOC118073704 [Chelonus insularis]